MIKKLLFLFPLIVLAVCSKLSAAPLAVSSNPLPYGKTLTINSIVFGQEKRVDIYFPSGYELDAKTVTYPVIYTFEKWTLSQAVSGVVSHLQNTAAMPRSIVVSLHDEPWPYLPNMYVHNTRNWGHDKTDGTSSIFKANHIDGNDDKLFQFFKKELFPLIENKYRGNEFRVLVGMSPSAMVGLHTLLHEPELFNGYILNASTDLLGLGYSKEESLVDAIVHLTKSNQFTANKYLYIASAAEEAVRDPARAQNVAELNKRLANNQSKLQIKAEFVEGFGHYPMALHGLINGLDLIFPRGDFASFRSLLNAGGDVVAAIEAHYQMLSDRYGVVIPPQPDLKRNINSLRAIGIQLTRRDELEQAAAAFKLWVSQSDKNPNAYYHLTDAYLALGEIDLAQKQLKIALDLIPEEEVLQRKNFENKLAEISQFKTKP